MRRRGRLTVAGAVGAATAAVAAAVLPTVVSGDLTYALIWGRQLADGDLTTFAPGPTPHPLAIGFGALASVLGTDDAYLAARVTFGPVALGGVVGASFAIVSRHSSAWGALLGTLVLVTSLPLLFATGQAGHDVSFSALVLGALAAELARPRRGWVPLALLALAGLLRPEAWLMAAAYYVWLALDQGWRARVGGAVLVAAAPCLWALMDLAVTGDPLWSLRVTGEISDALLEGSPDYSAADDLGQAGRDLAGLAGVLTLAAAAIGIGALVAAREPASLPIVAVLAASTLGFLAIVASGSATSPRYLILPGCLLVVAAATAAGRGFVGTGRVGLGLAASALLIAQVLVRVDAPAAARDALEPGPRWVHDAARLSSSGRSAELLERCPRVALASQKMLPFFAYFSGRGPAAWLADDRGAVRADAFVAPADREVAEVFLTHRRYDLDASFAVPPGLRPVAASRAWTVYARPGARCVTATTSP